MERLINKHKRLVQGLTTLKDVLERLSEYPDLYPELRDSTIKRFEYCVDMFWKYIKIYIETKHALKPLASPKGVFTNARDIPLFTGSEYVQLIHMINARNMSSHTYDENIAEELMNEIPSYHTIMCGLSKKLHP